MPEVNKVHLQLDSIPLDPINSNLLLKLGTNPLIELLDTRRIGNLISGSNPDKKARALTLLINAING